MVVLLLLVEVLLVVLSTVLTQLQQPGGGWRPTCGMPGACACVRGERANERG